MARQFVHHIDRLTLGLLLALTACAPRPIPGSPDDRPPSTQESILSTPSSAPTDPPAPARPAPLGIAANRGWQDAYQFVHPGDKLEITADGTWSHDPSSPTFSIPYGPAGVKVFDPKAVLASAPVGSLLGRIGDNPPFVVGEHLALTSEQRGELWFTINDRPDQLSDNTGSLGVTVLITLKPIGEGIRLTSTRDRYTLVYPDGYFVIMTPEGICLTQNASPDALPCNQPISASLEVRGAEGRTAAQLASEFINLNDPNFHFDSHDMLLDGEPAMWIDRQGGDGPLNMVMTVHAGHLYLWKFLFKELHPSLGQEAEVMAEQDQMQKFYDTVIDSFEFLD